MVSGLSLTGPGCPSPDRQAARTSSRKSSQGQLARWSYWRSQITTRLPPCSMTCESFQPSSKRLLRSRVKDPHVQIAFVDLGFVVTLVAKCHSRSPSLVDGCGHAHLLSRKASEETKVPRARRDGWIRLGLWSRWRLSTQIRDGGNRARSSSGRGGAARSSRSFSSSCSGSRRRESCRALAVPRRGVRSDGFFSRFVLELPPHVKPAPIPDDEASVIVLRKVDEEDLPGLLEGWEGHRDDADGFGWIQSVVREADEPPP